MGQEHRSRAWTKDMEGWLRNTCFVFQRAMAISCIPKAHGHFSFEVVFLFLCPQILSQRFHVLLCAATKRPSIWIFWSQPGLVSEQLLPSINCVM